MTTHLIIGSGFAGLKAAETIRRLDQVASVTILTAESDLPYWRPRLPDVIARITPEDKVTMRTSSWLHEHDISLRLGQPVVRINPADNRLELASGESVAYDTLLIATGSLARRPGRDIPGSDLDGVVTLRTLSDARSIATRLDSAQHTAVVGGGLLGIELVRAFRERGNQVTYFLKEDHFWPQMLDLTAARMVESRLLERGIDLRHQEVIAEIRGESGRVTGIKTSSGEEMRCQVIGYAIGAIPATAVLDGSGIKVDKGVLVDDHLRTSVPNVYAAGDVAQALDIVHGDHRVNTSVANAQAQGEVAGSNMAGTDRVFRGTVPSNTMQIYGIAFTCSGISIPIGPGYEEITGQYPKEGAYKKLVLKDGRLVGVMLLGDISEGRLAQELIAQGRDLTAVKDRLLTPGTELADLQA